MQAPRAAKAKSPSEKKLNKRGRRVLGLTLLTLFGTLVIQVVGFFVALVLRIPEDGLAFLATNEGVAAGSVVLGMMILGGIAWIRPSGEDVATTFRTCWPIVVVDAVAMGLGCAAFIAEGASVSPDWLSNLALTLLVCLGIGVFEEFLYRGIIFNGLLSVMGKTHRGTMAAIAVTSIWFGSAHIDLSVNLADPLLATQVVLKLVQTGLFSLILCEIVLRTRRLGGVSLFHGLSDFLLMVPSLVLAGESLTANYVSGGEEGMAGIVVYVISIAVYLPFAVKAVRRLRRERVTYRGVFMERAVAEYHDEVAAMSLQPMAA